MRHICAILGGIFLPELLICSVHNVFCLSAYKLINIGFAFFGEMPLAGSAFYTSQVIFDS
jgi:hypothetical protein